MGLCFLKTRRIPCLGIGLVVICCAASVVRAGGGAHNVVLIVDPEDPNSTYIANYYRNARSVPERNIFYFKPGTADYATFVADKVDSFLGMLATREVSDHADFVLIMPTNQYRVAAPGLISDLCSPVNNFSLTACYTLANLAASVQSGTLSSQEPNHYASTGTDITLPFHATPGYWNGNVNYSGSARKYFLAGMLGYTGVGGNSIAEITAMIDASVAADYTRVTGSATPPKKFYFCKTNDVNRSGPRDGSFPTAVTSINSVTSDPSAAVTLDLSSSGGALPPNGTTDCMGVMTGAAIPGVGASTIAIQPGAFCDHLTSYAGTFDDTSQEKMSAWIRKGATGTCGTVEEPCNFSGKFPHPRLHVYYAKQLTLGEACLRSLAFLPFQVLIYGDILCQPFTIHPAVTLPTPPNPLDLGGVSGSLVLTPSFSTTRAGASVNKCILYVNGKYHGTVTSSGGTFTIDTTTLPDGYSEFRAVAIDTTGIPSNNTENQFRRIKTYVVNNFGRSAVVSSVSPTTGGRDTRFAVTVDAAGGTPREIRLMANGRVFAAAATVPATFNLYGEMLGAGPVALTAVAEFTDGKLAQSQVQPLNITFGNPPTNLPQSAPPTAYSFSKDIPVNKPFILELPASDPDTAALSYTVSQNPAQATVAGTGRTRLIRPTALASGQDTLRFFVNDGSTNSASATITLRYNAPPLTFTQQPQSTTSCLGGTAVFTVAVSGTGPFTYQWQKDGNTIVGATSTTLSVTNVVAGSAGTYACVVTGPNRASLSNGAVLGVISSGPTIDTHPANVQVCASQPASFTVAASGPAPLSYQWRKNTVAIAAASQPTYMIASVSSADVGSYDCIVSNPCSSAPSNAATLALTQVVGDINGDCIADAADVARFVSVLLGADTDPGNVHRADLNGDGVADGADIQFFVNTIH